MKRDMDLVRHLLLEIEALAGDRPYDPFPQKSAQQANPDLVGHLRIMFEAGLLWGEEEDIIGEQGWYQIRLTWLGHEYLDTVRDSEIWRKTKEGAQKAGGFSLDLMTALAKGLIKKQIEKHTGVEIVL